MKLVLDILQGAGLAMSAGFRPFLPTLVAGGLASADLGVDFGGTEFAFLEDPWFLLIVAVALVVTVVGRARFEQGYGEAALAGAGTVLGALLFAASIDDRHATWWYGLIAGAALSLLAASVSRDLIGRVRDRFVAQGDPQAASALTIYLEGIALLTAACSVLAPPLAIVAIGLLLALRLRRGAGEDRKFAGLRTLR